MKTFWMTSWRDFVLYDPRIHLMEAYKFIYWEEKDGQEETIIIGWQEEFLRAYQWHPACHQDLAISAIAPNRKPDGAGYLHDGEVESWTSEGYKIETPENLRPRILELLGAEEIKKRSPSQEERKQEDLDTEDSPF
jgi:hypothetical protein